MSDHVTRVVSLPAATEAPHGAIAECTCGWASRVYTRADVVDGRSAAPAIVRPLITVYTLAATAGQVHRWARNLVDELFPDGDEGDGDR